MLGERATSSSQQTGGLGALFVVLSFTFWKHTMFWKLFGSVLRGACLAWVRPRPSWTPWHIMHIFSHPSRLALIRSHQRWHPSNIVITPSRDRAGARIVDAHERKHGHGTRGANEKRRHTTTHKHKNNTADTKCEAVPSGQPLHPSTPKHSDRGLQSLSSLLALLLRAVAICRCRRRTCRAG